MFDQRGAARTNMIIDAQIAFRDVVLRCAAFNVSSTGARICLFLPLEVPELVTLRLPDGQTRVASRRWRQGDQIGFEFLACQELTAGAAAL